MLRTIADGSEVVALAAAESRVQRKFAGGNLFRGLPRHNVLAVVFAGLEARAGLQEGDLQAGFSQRVGSDSASRAGADDTDIVSGQMGFS